MRHFHKLFLLPVSRTVFVMFHGKFKQLSSMYESEPKKTPSRPDVIWWADDSDSRSEVKTQTHTHTCSLLFSFLVAWELAEATETSHQLYKEPRGEVGNAAGGALWCLCVWMGQGATSR